jgi:hypothetical protein
LTKGRILKIRLVDQFRADELAKEQGRPTSDVQARLIKHRSSYSHSPNPPIFQEELTLSAMQRTAATDARYLAICSWFARRFNPNDLVLCRAITRLVEVRLCSVQHDRMIGQTILSYICPDDA